MRKINAKAHKERATGVIWLFLMMGFSIYFICF